MQRLGVLEVREVVGVVEGVLVPVRNGRLWAYGREEIASERVSV